MAADPIFVSTIRTEAGEISVANTNRDGTGTIVTIFTAGASGSKVVNIVVKAESNTTAGMVRLFLYDGATYSLWQEISISAITVSGTTQTFYASIAPDLILETGWSVRASTHNAEVFNVIITGGDY